jgi:hypothetical protein
VTPNEATRAITQISKTLAESPSDEAKRALSNLTELSKYLTLLELDYTSHHANPM